MRKVVTISMPDEMHAHIVRRLSRTRYASVSEYIRELIRRDEIAFSKNGVSTPPVPAPEPHRDDVFIVKPLNEFMKETLAEKKAGPGPY